MIQSKFARLLTRLYGSRRLGVLQNGINEWQVYKQGDTRLGIATVEMIHPTWTHWYFVLTNRVKWGWRVLEKRRQGRSTIVVMAKADRYPADLRTLRDLQRAATDAAVAVRQHEAG